MQANSSPVTKPQSRRPALRLWAVCSLLAAAVAHSDPFVLFEEDADWLLRHQDRGFEGEITLSTADPYTGQACLRVTPHQGLVSGWNLPIRQKPRLGEYRYLTLAFKKHGGPSLVVHFGGGPRNVIHNTHAGWPIWWPSVELLREAPTDWRAFEGDEALDLYQLFGEFDLTYLSFAPLDGEWGRFDHVVLTSTLEEARALLDPAALRRHVAPDLEKRIVQFGQMANELSKPRNVWSPGGPILRLPLRHAQGFGSPGQDWFGGGPQQVETSGTKLPPPGDLSAGGGGRSGDPPPTRNGPGVVGKRARQELAGAKEELRLAYACLKEATAPGDRATQNAHRHLLRCRRLLDGEVSRWFA